MKSRIKAHYIKVDKQTGNRNMESVEFDSEDHAIKWHQSMQEAAHAISFKIEKFNINYVS